MKKLRGKALGWKTRIRRNNASSTRGRNDTLSRRELLKINENVSPVGDAGIRQAKDGELGLRRQHEEDRIQVSMKHLNQSIFVFIHGVNSNSPYRIENRSLDHVIHFRQ